MYFRIKKTSSGHVLQFVESCRSKQGTPRQRIIVSLGNAAIPKCHWSQIAAAITDYLHAQENIFSKTYPKEIQEWIDYIKRRIATKVDSSEKADEVHVDGVILDRVEHSITSELGPELAGLHAWKRLRIDELLKDLGFNALQRKTAAISVINRLVSPVSERSLETWVPQTALPELLGEDVLRQGKDRYYRISDRLLEYQKPIEAHMRNQQQKLFNLNRTVLLYDLTNTHFEGACRNNPKAAYGKNKQKRNDCPQVVVGMVFDGDGFELGHKVFEGNQSDSKSLVKMLETLEEAVTDTDCGGDAGAVKPIVILDGGIATHSNLAVLRKKGFSYLVNDSRRCRITYKEQFNDESSFDEIPGRGKKPPVQVSFIEEERDGATEGKDTVPEKEYVVLCKSAARGKKEKAIVSNAEKRYLDNLEKLSKRISSGKLVDMEKVQRSIGRIQAKNSRVQRYYTVKVTGSDRAEKLVWQRKDAELNDAEKLYGCYVLRTDMNTLSKVELWQLYITLTRAEDGFQALKRDLGLRPNRHHIESRVDAHINITVLAYQLMCYLNRILEEKGDYRDWDTIRRVLQTHSYTTIVLPTKNGKVYHIRKASHPEECQKEIYMNLGVDWHNLPTMKNQYCKANRNTKK